MTMNSPKLSIEPAPAGLARPQADSLGRSSGLAMFLDHVLLSSWLVVARSPRITLARDQRPRRRQPVVAESDQGLPCLGEVDLGLRRTAIAGSVNGPSARSRASRSSRASCSRVASACSAA